MFLQSPRLAHREPGAWLGVTWIQVQVSEDPLARRALRIYSSSVLGSAPEMYIGRIVALPGDGVAVFLGSPFVGLLPPESAQAMHPIALETDAADRKLHVEGRIAGVDGVWTLAVALP